MKPKVFDEWWEEFLAQRIQGAFSEEDREMAKTAWTAAVRACAEVATDLENEMRESAKKFIAFPKEKAVLDMVANGLAEFRKRLEEE